MAGGNPKFWILRGENGPHLIHEQFDLFTVGIPLADTDSGRVFKSAAEKIW